MSNQENQQAVIIINIPRKFLTVFIHCPGRGKNIMSLGAAATIKYGLAKPKPINENMIRDFTPPNVRANATAEPKKGAEQGVASNAAKQPLKKSPVKPFLLES